MTPSTPRTNPFDIYDPSELTMSIVSPSVFGISKERSNGKTTFISALIWIIFLNFFVFVTYYDNAIRILLLPGSLADKEPSASENVEENDTGPKPFRCF